MINWFKRLKSRFFSRKTKIKFYYQKRSEADAVFNALTDFFIDRRNGYKIVKSKIYDSSPFSSAQFLWCVYFKIEELDNCRGLTFEELKRIKADALSKR